MEITFAELLDIVVGGYFFVTQNITFKEILSMLINLIIAGGAIGTFVYTINSYKDRKNKDETLLRMQKYSELTKYYNELNLFSDTKALAENYRKYMFEYYENNPDRNEKNEFGTVEYRKIKRQTFYNVLQKVYFLYEYMKFSRILDVEYLLIYLPSINNLNYFDNLKYDPIANLKLNFYGIHYWENEVKKHNLPDDILLYLKAYKKLLGIWDEYGNQIKI